MSDHITFFLFDSYNIIPLNVFFPFIKWQTF